MGNYTIYALRFQLTHPRGVRHAQARTGSVWTSYFNSRTRVGCDHTHALRCCVRVHFNSRTRVGCDSAQNLTLSRTMNFNSRTRVGCDAISFPQLSKSSNFNSRTRVGCDFDIIRRRWRITISTHAPAWGATMISIYSII